MKRRISNKQRKELRREGKFTARVFCGKCMKRTYKTEEEAEQQIEITDGRAGTRAYECPLDGWHLTKRELDEVW